MHGLLEDESGLIVSSEAVVQDNRYRLEGLRQTCKPLWLTPREAESLLVLCVASPVTAGPVEQDLFMKLGEFFRSYRA